MSDRDARTGSAGRRASDLDATLPQPRQRVDLRPVDPAQVHLEVQVWTGGLAAVAEQGDRVARLHRLTGLDEDLLHVAVDGDVAVRVLDVDGEPEAAGGTGTDDHAV